MPEFLWVWVGWHGTTRSRDFSMRILINGKANLWRQTKVRYVDLNNVKDKDKDKEKDELVERFQVCQVVLTCVNAMHGFS